MSRESSEFWLTPHQMRMRLAAGIGCAAMVLLTGSTVEPAGHVAVNAAEAVYARCDALDVTVVDPAKREVEFTPNFTVENGARFTEVVYDFDLGNPGAIAPSSFQEVVSADENPSGTLDYKFPLTPGERTDTVTAIIDYGLPGAENRYGATQTCTQAVTFTDAPVVTTR